MQQPNYVLENNRTPATHFIEVWKSKKETIHFPKFLTERRCVKMEQLETYLALTRAKENLHTYAIFKIHPKCN